MFFLSVHFLLFYVCVVLLQRALIDFVIITKNHGTNLTWYEIIENPVRYDVGIVESVEYNGIFTSCTVQTDTRESKEASFDSPSFSILN